jgi:hypothetical protein
VSAILECGKNDEQRALALHRALIHPKIREIAKSAGFQNEKMKELSYHSEQIKEYISLASHTRNIQGRPKKEESEVMDTIVVALSADFFFEGAKSTQRPVYVTALWRLESAYKERNVEPTKDCPCKSFRSSMVEYFETSA